MTARSIEIGHTVSADESPARPTTRAWLVFGVSFALLLSDYMSRQVLAAVFPLLKVQWSLSDSQLGTLGGVVALMVGLLTFPFSLLADRVGRARSVAAMALTWSVATLACGLAASYGQLLLARLALGVGEAAYGSVGLAVVFTYFPRTMRATITSAFMAGGVFGSFIGLVLGGAVSAQMGWRGSFNVMGGIGLALVVGYVLIVRDRPRPASQVKSASSPSVFSLPGVLRGLFGDPGVVLTYIASGLQLFVLGAITAWAPSYLNRQYALSPAAAASTAAVLLLSCGVGMVVWGGLSDRLSKARPQRRPALAAALGLSTFVLLEAALLLPHGALQTLCAVIGLFCAGGTTGPAGAVVADRTPPLLHGAALAVLTLANNLIGLAPGPAVTGALADRLGLQAALQVAACFALFAAGVFWLSGRFRNSNPQTGPQRA
ncbi:MFS transporter [Phenylobacterium sp.]|jgi:MFS family permease|uniref:MFS transporter n=1 Tax=Phenylobacterium sp. TaxID=1871053 RepID=UPI002F42289F